MEEVHHTQKLDAPSGTAISLAKWQLKIAIHWTLDNPTASDTNNGKQAKQIHIEAKRIGTVPGTHGDILQQLMLSK
jgi:4-hydroxy-tetrahydrodipicolinate reductase